MVLAKDKKYNLFKRLWIYQKERFPLLPYILMSTAFTFSAASYSRISRHETGFISIEYFIVGALTSFIFFFLLRIFDEFKDAEKDAKYQSYRPVPRGLVSFNELVWLAFFLILVQLLMNFFIMPAIIIVYLLVMTYIALMTKEFFIKEWIVKHPVVYLVSHMFVMPLIDLYTTGLDWVNEGVSPSRGLIFFLILTFCNGVVIEIGRKIKNPDAEEPGVETYSALWGCGRASHIWLTVLLITFVFACISSYMAGYGLVCFVFLLVFLVLCSIPCLLFLKFRDQKHAKLIEISSGIWTIAMYLTLGGVPMIYELIMANIA